MFTPATFVYLLWLASEIILNRVMRGSSSDKQRKDSGSLVIIWVVIIVSLVAAGNLAAVNSTPICQSYTTMLYTGLVIILLGVALRLAAVISLGKYFTVAVRIREGHQVKQDGMYKLVRHPSYAASLLSFIGYGISLNNWISLAVTIIPVFAAFLYRMNVEEKVLLENFGKEYSDYMARTKRLVPFVY
ncbi:Protein-S-isoprenylcysteine O-methyltransferase Ste14 [Chitinophaga jiangningensis]|uniref:Protein-S-isoprenylcysteine O-methyltransferase Ste14 n=1 Tax=Chitinophaga jiangningensis TaxID=1419482 RepID=A0A1M7MXX3_9BACT|nr:isoprenylcysteine carboxylmethyltransferase family protein [Chitinophaga jiangningensis]SHM96041.1 Protein-S-isoprenylcysteine O-methyltransferase Ste14 [Chitinophaga jiangningensis]